MAPSVPPTPQPKSSIQTQAALFASRMEEVTRKADKEVAEAEKRAEKKDLEAQKRAEKKAQEAEKRAAKQAKEAEKRRAAKQAEEAEKRRAAKQAEKQAKQLAEAERKAEQVIHNCISSAKEGEGFALPIHTSYYFALVGILGTNLHHCP